MGVLRVKSGVQFQVIAPGGFRILSALERVARALLVDLWITSGTDGVHSGPADPHPRGEAYDVRSTEFATPETKDGFLRQLMAAFEDGPAYPQDGGYVTTRWFAWLEDAGGANEHFHVQLRRFLNYP